MNENEPYFITKDPDGNPCHVYQDAAGNELMSTTQICKLGLGLYMRKGTSPAAEKGTHIHTACQWYDEKSLDKKSLDPVIRPYVEQYNLALEEKGITVIQNEVRRYSPKYLFAGTLDKIAQIDGKWCIIDIKSGKVEKWHALQLAAYKELMGSEVKIENVYALYLREDGYELINYDDPMMFAYFLSLKTSTEIRIKLGYV